MEKNHEIAKHIKGTTDRIIIFFEKTKVFERKPQVSKRDLYPKRIIRHGRNKRKNSIKISK